jgi:hypothetical protein
MTKPKVLIDGIAFENRQHIGTWRVFYECINRLEACVDFYILLEHEPRNPIPNGVEVIRSNHRKVGRKFFRPVVAAFKGHSIASIERYFRDAIWHSSYFSTDPRRKKKSLVHVYDMIAERFYHLSELLEQQCQLKSEAIAAADLILTISNTTTDEFLRFYPTFKNRVITAPLGATHLCRQSIDLPDRGTDCLFVGHRNSYKNFQIVVRAMNSPIWPPQVRLIVVGLPFSDSEKRFIKYQGVQNKIVHLGKIIDDQLACEYARSMALVFPSLCEGFGLPVLEAQSYRCVPILSDIPIFNEVSGSAAMFFNPHDPCSLALAVKQCFEKKAEDKLDAGLSNAARYSWDSTAEITMKCYNLLSSV